MSFRNGERTGSSISRDGRQGQHGHHAAILADPKFFDTDKFASMT